MYHIRIGFPGAVAFGTALLLDASAFAADPECGHGNGQMATGEPIKLGAIVGETGPDDFSSTADAAGRISIA